MTVKKASKGKIDQYALLAQQEAELKKKLKELRPAIEALGEGTHVGLTYSLHITKVKSSSLSIPIVKSLLTPAEIAQATVTSESLRITVEH